MNKEKARTFYQSLTPEQKHFVDNKTINATMSVRHWISFLDKTSKYDAVRDQQSTNLVFGIVLSALGILVAIIIGFNGGDLRVVVGAGTLFLLVLILLVRRRMMLGKRNLSNYLRTFFVPVLTVLRDKAGEDAKMIAALDFRDPVKVLPFEKIEEPHLSRTVKLYTPKMITAGVTLKDGSYLEMVVLDEIRKIVKRTARKTKYMTKTTHRLFIRLTVPKAIYEKEGMPDAHVEVEEQADQYICKLKYKEKEMSNGMLKPAILIGQMALLYGMFSSRPGVEVPTFTEGIAMAGQQAGVNDLMWNDQIFSQYDHDSFSRRNRGISSGNHEGHTFDS